MLTSYATDKNHDIVLLYKYIAEGNAFMTYLSVAEKNSGFNKNVIIQRLYQTTKILSYQTNRRHIDHHFLKFYFNNNFLIHYLK